MVIQVRRNGLEHWVAVDKAKSLSTATVYIKATYKWDSTAHPRYICYECSVCGQIKEAIDKENYVIGCEYCIRYACAIVYNLDVPSILTQGCDIELSGSMSASCHLSWLWLGILDKDNGAIIDSAELESGEYTLSIEGTGAGKYWIVYSKELTCTESGLMEGKHCDICKEVLVQQEVIVMRSHAWDKGSLCGNLLLLPRSAGAELHKLWAGKEGRIAEVGKCRG